MRACCSHLTFSRRLSIILYCYLSGTKTFWMLCCSLEPPMQPQSTVTHRNDLPWIEDPFTVLDFVTCVYVQVTTLQTCWQNKSTAVASPCTKLP